MVSWWVPHHNFVGSFRRIRRKVEATSHVIATLARRKPLVEVQAEATDCGYVCISAIMAMLGAPMMVDQVKERVGTTARGLKLNQLRDGMRRCGLSAEAVYFDRKRIEALPIPSIVLLRHGHYVVISDRKDQRFEVFNPQVGWTWMDFRKLSRCCSGFGVSAGNVSNLTEHRRIYEQRRRLSRLPLPRGFFQNRYVRLAFVVFAFAQVVTLLVPLVSAWAVNSAVDDLSLSLLGIVAVGFAALSATNISVSLFADLLQSRTKRLTTSALSRTTFEALSSKPPYWFDLNGPTTLQQKLASIDLQLDFQIDAVRAYGGLAITILAGGLVLLFISPVLLIPGIIGLAITILLDVIFERTQRSQFASTVETSQRRQRFVHETLSQLPALARFGSLLPAKMRFVSHARAVASVEAAADSLRGWRGALNSLLKSGETLFFVTVAASLMGDGRYSLGAFVALGAYKNLLADAILSAFQLSMKSRSIDVHRMQAATLLEGDERSRTTRVLSEGQIVASGVSFRYGTLDANVFSDVNFQATARQCTIIRGPSGAGKSTFARLLVKNLEPTQGSIAIDGLPLCDTMIGMASVLQQDRLIGGTIRENVTMLRPLVSDEEIFDALEIAEISKFVSSLPMGLNTLVGEGVTSISGGQRQRLLIARAVLRSPRLLILDEATSSLDVETESKILTNLRNRGITTILIAHRPEVWRFADQVFSFDEAGRLSCDSMECRLSSVAN